MFKEFFGSVYDDREAVLPNDKIAKMNKRIEKEFILNQDALEKLIQFNDNFKSLDTLFLSATIFTLTKFIYSKKILITKLTKKENIFNKKHSLVKAIVAKDINTKDTVEDYLSQVEDLINNIEHCNPAIFEEVKKEFNLDLSHFQYYYQKYEDVSDLKFFPESDFTIIVKEQTGKQNGKIDRIKVKFMYNGAFYSEKMVELFYDSLLIILTKFMDKKSLLKDVGLREPDSIPCSFKTQETQLVNELFEKIVTENKNKYALVATDRNLTFNDLDLGSNIIANELIKRGLRKGDKVLIVLNRDSKLITSIFGVIKAGGVFIIVSPDDPTHRINFIKDQTDTRFLISFKVFIDKILSYSKDSSPHTYFENNFEDHGNDFCNKHSKSNGTYCIDINRLINGENERLPVVDLKSTDILCIVYTSGSTGSPKGVTLSHNSIPDINSLRSIFKLTNLNFGGDDKYLLDLGQNFTVAFFSELLIFLSYGVTIVLNNEKQLTDPRELLSLYERTKFNMMVTIPSKLNEYLELDQIKDLTKKLKMIVFLGEKHTPDLINRIKSLNKDISLVNVYGSSETFLSNIKLIDEYNQFIGKPVQFFNEIVADLDNNPLPQGIAGELLIGGNNLAKNYYDDEELTKKKFIKINDMSFFKTGEFVKSVGEDFVLLGRLDNQIKLRGQRIDPGEIENNVPEDIGVEKAIVTVNNKNDNQVLALYFTTQSKSLMNDEIVKIKEMIRSHLVDKLSGFMVPQDYVYLEEFPKTGTGKVNVKDLKNHDDNIKEIVKPSTDLEQELFDLCVDILGYDDFGVTNSLISIGFTSLSIIRLLNKILEKYQIELELFTIVNEDINIRSLSKLIEKSTVVSYGKHELRDFYPLTSQQFGVYYDSLLNEDKVMYNIPGVLRLDGANVFRVKKALDETIKLHSYLNTELIDVDGVIYQKPSAKEHDIVIHDGYLLMKIKKEFVKPFKLHNELLYRLELYYDNVGGVVFVFFDFHHVLIDGESLNCFIGDFLKIYNGESLSSEEFTTYDLAIDEEEYLNSKEYLIDGEFFKSELGSFDGELTVPSDKSNYLGYGKEKNQRISLNKNIVNDLSKKLNITPNICFLSALSLSVSKFTNNRQVLFSTIFNQRDSRYYNSLGMMVKTIPIVLDIDYESVLNDFIRMVNDHHWLNLEHSKYPFADIINDNGLKPEILYVYQDDLFQFNHDNASFESLVTDSVAKFKLTIEVHSLDNEYLVDIKYDSRFYSDYIIKSFINFIKSTLFNFKRNLKQSLNQIDFLNPDEKDLLLNELNNTYIDNNQSKTVVNLFEENVRTNPDKVALVYKDEELTYDELNTMVNRLANYLLEHGIHNNGVFVPLVLCRSPFMIVSILAVLKCGCAYVPIVPNSPENRIKHILEDVNAEIVLTDNQNHEYMNEIITDNNDSLFIVDVETLFSSSVLDDVSSSNLNVDIGLVDPVYVIYTSGSTGKPKGVIISHDSLINLYLSTNEIYDFISDDIWVLFHSYNFDFSVWEIFGSLLNSSKLIIPEGHVIKDTNLFYDLVEKKDVSVLNQTPLAFYQFIDVHENKEKKLNLRCIIFGGDKLNFENISKWYKINSGKNKPLLYNMYGITEICVHASYKQLNEKIVENTDKSIIGKILSDSTSYILDDNQLLLPKGAIGELCIGGVGLAREYLNNSELTNEKFILNPYQTIEQKKAGFNGRLYRTGDLVRLNEDNDLEYCCRCDFQVKIRGYRIELGEIENILTKIDEIKQAIVLVLDDRLIAYYLSDENIDDEFIKNELSAYLPDYMIPTTYIKIDKIPLTKNGKIDKKELSLKLKTEEKLIYIFPNTPLEKEIFSMCSDILGHENFGVNTNLSTVFSSLTIVKLSSKILEKYNVELNLNKIMKNFTNNITNFCEEIEKSSKLYNMNKLRKYYPISPQQTTYFSKRDETGTTDNVTFLIDFDKDISDIIRIKDALIKTVEIHSYLKTHFININDKIYQKINENCEVDIEIHEKKLTPIIKKKKFVRPFNLFKGPLFRFELYLHNNKVNLLMDIHHIILDINSIITFCDDLLAIYMGENVPEEEFTYLDYCVDLMENYEENVDLAKNYYKKYLSTISIFNYIKSTLIKSEGHQTKNITVEIDFNEINQVQSVSEYSYDDFVLTSLILALNDFLKSEHIYLEYISNGRDRSRYSRSFGLFRKYIPLFFSLDKYEDIKDFLRIVRETLDDGIIMYPTDLTENFMKFFHEINSPKIFYTFTDMRTNNKKYNLSILPTKKTWKNELAVRIIVYDQKSLIIVDYDSYNYLQQDIENLINLVQYYLGEIVKSFC